jgi:hypothetical protein
MIGRCLMRRPGAWKTALAMAGATPTTASSPKAYGRRPGTGTPRSGLHAG